MKPLLVTDGTYVFAHHDGRIMGPFSVRVTDSGQVADEEFNSSDPSGLPFNPRNCIGGRVHVVDNPMVLPDNLADGESIEIKGTTGRNGANGGDVTVVGPLRAGDGMPGVKGGDIVIKGGDIE